MVSQESLDIFAEAIIQPVIDVTNETVLGGATQERRVTEGSNWRIEVNRPDCVDMIVEQPLPSEQRVYPESLSVSQMYVRPIVTT